MLNVIKEFNKTFEKKQFKHENNTHKNNNTLMLKTLKNVKNCRTRG